MSILFAWPGIGPQVRFSEHVNEWLRLNSTRWNEEGRKIRELLCGTNGSGLGCAVLEIKEGNVVLRFPARRAKG